VPALVGTDEKRLRQIIINLLSNALRYTESGHVDLDLTYRNEVAVITVRDTGVGIEPENVERIWRPFERAGRSDRQGSGLGLTITKLLVEIMGGEIGVDSAPGKGSVFTVRMMLPSISTSVFDTENLNKSVHQPGLVGYRGPRKTVLVVDDDINHLGLTDQFLSNLGFVVLVAASADLAEQMLSEATPDLIVRDIDMPERDGWSFADDLLMQIAELLKVTLILESENDAEKPIPPDLTEADRKILLESAALGHAAGVRAQLDKLRKEHRGATSLLDLLEKRLDRFDMAGIAEALEATRDGV
jgi:CheY-like chemotaxis protein/anti-sigma regulatory factor (Ser/Thr protein kinase)